MSSIQNRVYYSQGSAREPITPTCLIKRGIKNVITLVPWAFLFVDKGEHLISVLLCKSNLECKKICASDWLKLPTSMLITLVFCFIFKI